MADEALEDVSYADNGRNSDDSDNDLEDMGQCKNEVINISPAYQPKWGPEEGFREVFQNWKDGIMRSFGIGERSFKIESEHTDFQRLFLVFHPDKPPKQLLGYIRFVYDYKSEETEALGSCEVTNFKASLRRRHLGIGGTSKANDNTQLGQHGEGLKLSALVNRRHPHNYSFAVISSGCRWTFGWNVDLKLNCRIQRISKPELRKQKAQAGDKTVDAPREAKAHAWEDVSVLIGVEQHHCRSLAGEKKTTSKIPLKDFEAWTERFMDLYPPHDVVRTDSGDLILDPAYENKLYLHGIQLPSGSKGGKPYRFGYNFLKATTGRDRDTVVSARGEARMITAIWAAALKEEHKAGKTELLSKYTELLRRQFNAYADVHNIAYVMSKDTLEMVWDYMKTTNHNSFFYCESADPRESQVVRTQLGMNAVALSSALWNFLRQRSICRTPSEECERRFQLAREVRPKSESFPQHIVTALRALTNLDQAFQGKKIIVVAAKDLGVMILDKITGVFKIAEEYLTYEGAHRETFCPNEHEGAHKLNNFFSCDHAILYLWDVMISTIQQAGDSEFTITPQHERFLRSIARAKVQEMPRDIHFMTNDERNELIIYWTSMEPRKNRDRALRVVLHSAGCHDGSRWTTTLVHNQSFQRNFLGSGSRPCICPSQTATDNIGHVTFTGVRQELSYYPMLSRDETDAIYGIVLEKPLRLHSLEVLEVVKDKSEEEETAEEAEVYPSFKEISKLFEISPPRDWTSVPYNRLVQEGFPYAHTWISGKQDDLQLLIAKSKVTSLKQGLKRAIEDVESVQPIPEKREAKPRKKASPVEEEESVKALPKKRMAKLPKKASTIWNDDVL